MPAVGVVVDLLEKDGVYALSASFTEDRLNFVFGSLMLKLAILAGPSPG
jgi:hypothetical protein